MKEIIGYLRWVFTGLEIWHWMLLSSLVFNIASLVFFKTPYSSMLNTIGMCLLLAVFFKWFFYDMIKFSWNRYREQRNELFSAIKESDK